MFEEDVDEEDLEALKEATSALRTEDGVLDAEFTNRVRLYSRLQSSVSGSNMMANVKVGMELAVDSYKGYTQMVNLLVDWSKEFLESKTIHDTFVGCVRHTCHSVLIDTATAKLDPRARALLEQIRNDPSLIDSELHSILSGDLSTIRAHSSMDASVSGGMDLVNEDSAMASVSGAHILSRHKFEARVFKYLRQILLKRPKREDFENRLENFAKFVCKNELYFMHCRCLLTEMRSHCFERPIDFALSQVIAAIDLKASTLSSKTPELCAMSGGMQRGSALRTASIELFKNKALTEVDLGNLRRECCGARGGLLRSHLLFLRQSPVIDLLYDKVFIPQRRQLSPVALEDCIHLLAIAHCRVTDSHSDFSSAIAKGTDKSIGTVAISSKMSDATMVASSSAFDSVSDSHSVGVSVGDDVGSVDTTETVKWLTRVSGICHDAKFGVTLSRDKTKQNTLCNGQSAQPIVAKGILLWVRHSMNSQSYFNAIFESYMTRFFFWLVAEIAKTHPFLRKGVAEFCSDLIKAKKKDLAALKEVELCRKLVEMLAYVIQLGYFEAFELFEREHMAALDRTVLRQFTTLLVSAISPEKAPKRFVHALQRCLRLPHFAQSVSSNPNTASAIDSFLKRVK